MDSVETKVAVLEATLSAKLDELKADTSEIKGHLEKLNGRTRKNEDAILVLQQAQAPTPTPSAAGVTKAHVAVGSGAAAGIVVLIEVLHQALPAIQQLFAK